MIQASTYGWINPKDEEIKIQSNPNDGKILVKKNFYFVQQSKWVSSDHPNIKIHEEFVEKDLIFYIAIVYLV